MYHVPYYKSHEEPLENFYPRITSSPRSMYLRALSRFFIYKKTVCILKSNAKSSKQITYEFMIKSYNAFLVAVVIT